MPCFIFVDLIIFIILVFIKAKILFEYSGAKSFFCSEIKKQYPDVGERLIARLLLQQIWTVRVSIVAGFH